MAIADCPSRGMKKPTGPDAEYRLKATITIVRKAISFFKETGRMWYNRNNIPAYENEIQSG